MILKALIVDDEYPARQELRYLLDRLNDIEVVGEAAGATEAMKLIDALEYDIVFLDINLPGMNGLELTDKIKSHPHKPHVIFITAYENFAVDAFKVNATDYILKPIETGRLKQAINKVIESKRAEQPIHTKEPVYPNESEDMTEEKDSVSKFERIIAESAGRMILVDVNDICFIYTEGDSVYLKTMTEKLFTRNTLKELEEKLSQKSFVRTHRSFIVNIRRVKEIQPLFNGTYNLIIDDKEKSEVPVSRSNAQKLRRLFGKAAAD